MLLLKINNLLIFIFIHIMDITSFFVLSVTDEYS